MFKILLGIFLFLLIIFIHELGHFATAKMLKIYVYEFAVGFGPKLFKWKRKETNYSIRLLPLGGFCNFDPPEDDNLVDKYNDVSLLNDCKPWKRFLVLISGVLYNLLSILVAVFILNIFIGYPSLEISEVLDNSIAYEYNIKSGDEIISVNDKFFKDAEELINSKELLKSDIKIDIKSTNGEQRHIIINKISGEKIGVTFKYKTNILRALKDFIPTYINFTKNIFNQFIGIFKNVQTDQLMGPVGVLSYISNQTISVLNYLMLFIGISYSVAFFNLIPMPPLDGGLIILLIIEKIFNKKISEIISKTLIIIGTIILLGLTFFVLYRDVIKLF